MSTRLFVVLSLLTCSASLGAELFEERSVLPLELDAPLRSLISNRHGESPYHPAELRYRGTDGSDVVLPVEVRTRGKTRRRPDICAFPPLRVRFDDANNSLFGGQRSLKLVTHCQDRDSYDQLVLQEYLVYRAYSQLTTRGHRVRLVQISYLEGDNLRTTRYGILLEDWRAVAERNDLIAQPIDGAVNINKLSAFDMNRVALFQYMIGNDDWSALWPEPDEDCCHNMRPLIDADGMVVPLPYDFDFARIVNVPYAATNGVFANTVGRLYGGLCPTQADLPAALELFRQRREMIYSVYRTETALNPRPLKFSLAALDRFYNVINDPDLVARRMTSKCMSN